MLLAPLTALAVAAGPAAGLDRLAREDGIVLLPGEADAPWTDQLVAELRAGLARLPAPMRRFPGGPLLVRLHARAMPFGMGDGSDGAPEWTEGRSCFHLYAVAPSGERHAERRLRSLDAGAQERLWRERAIVHAVVARWDEALGLSARRSWRRLNGWIRPLERPFTFRERVLSTFSGAFSRERGRASAALDLATFAEERFVPVESLVPGALPADETVRCREPSKARVLDALLSEARLLDGPPERRGACPDLDAWAELELLEGIEVLLMSSSGRAPESLFGHVLLRTVHREGERVRGPSFESAVQIVALTDDDAGAGYFVRGILGGYPTIVSTVSAADFTRSALVEEQRVVRRFRLDLDRAEMGQVLERVWELEGRGYFDYQFFTDNCASFLSFLLEGALPEDVTLGRAWRPFAIPSGVLDDLAEVRLERRRRDGTVEERPLLVAVAGDLEPSGDVARRAQDERERGEEVLLATPGPHRERLARGFRRARSSATETRRAAYEDLATLAREVREPRLQEAMYDWWEHTVELERYWLDLARNEQRRSEERARRASRRGEGGRGEAALRAAIAARQAEFEGEPEDGGAPEPESEPEAGSDGESSRRRAEPQQATEELRASRARALAEEETFRRLTDLQGGLVAGPLAGLDPHDWLERHAREREREQASAMAGALPGSGLWRAALGFGARATNDGAGARPTVVLSAAVLAEPLGERRLRGLRGDAGMRVLDGRLELTPGSGAASVARADLTVVAFRTLEREPRAVRRGLLDQLGWGFELGVDRWPGRELEHRARVQAELHAILREDPRLRDHTLLGFGVGAMVGWGGGDAGAGAGPRVSLSHRRSFGSAGRAFVAEATYWPTLDARARIEQEARLEAGLSWLVGDPARTAVILRPEVVAEATWGARDVRAAELVLRAELP